MDKYYHGHFTAICMYPTSKRNKSESIKKNSQGVLLMLSY